MGVAMKRHVFTLLAAGLLALPAHAEWRKFDGQSVPLLTADKWLNTDRMKPDTSEMRGKVYIIKFFATW